MLFLCKTLILFSLLLSPEVFSQALESDASFYVLPVQSESKIDSQAVEYRLNESLTESGAKIKRDFQTLKTLRTFNYSIGRSLDLVFSTIKPDFVLSMVVKKADKDRLEYNFNIYNAEKISVFNKIHSDFASVDLEPKVISDWVSEFLGALPRSGTIESVDEKVVKISFGRALDVDKMKGLDFVVTHISRKEEVSDGDALARGVIVSSEGQKLIGNLYDASGEVTVGQRVLILQSEGGDESAAKKGIELTDRSLIHTNPFTFSMRSCVMLPIIGEKNFDRDFFEELQESLMDTDRCNFRDGSEIKKILEGFGSQKEHLYNPQVLSVIAKKMTAGAIVRVSLDAGILGTKVAMDVIAENGMDVYFSRTKMISNKNPEFIMQILKSWLHLYSELVPYHGLVTKIIKGEKILINFGGKNLALADTKFKIVKPTHLSIYNYNGLSQVQWKKEALGDGAFEEIHDDYSVGSITKVTNPKYKIAEGDWVIADKILTEEEKVKDLIAQARDRGFSNKGRMSFGAEISRLNSSRSGASGNVFGAIADIAYYTETIFNLYGEAKKDVGAAAGFNADGKSLDGAVGFSIIPKADFFPMVIDFMLGYRYKEVNYEGLRERFVGKLTSHGPYVGAILEFPIYNKFSLLGSFKYGPKDTAKNSIKIIGEIKDSNSTEIQVKGIYKYHKHYGLYASFVYQNYVDNYYLDDVAIKNKSSVTRFGFILDF